MLFLSSPTAVSRAFSVHIKATFYDQKTDQILLFLKHNDSWLLCSLGLRCLSLLHLGFVAMMWFHSDTLWFIPCTISLVFQFLCRSPKALFLAWHGEFIPFRAWMLWIPARNLTRSLFLSVAICSYLPRSFHLTPWASPLQHWLKLLLLINL